MNLVQLKKRKDKKNKLNLFNNHLILDKSNIIMYINRNKPSNEASRLKFCHSLKNLE